MKKQVIGLLGAAVLAWIVAPSSSLAQAPARDYSFESFEACPGCSSQTGGINNQGLVGVAVLSPGQFFPAGYVYDSRAGLGTPIPNTIAAAVPNNRGHITLGSISPSGQVVTLLRERDGAISPLDNFPGAALTLLIELKEDGSGTGYASRDFGTFFGVVRTSDARSTEINYPAA